jgi:hypothetical protein
VPQRFIVIDIRTPVSRIEGIGSATAAALATVRVFTVFDLLRVRHDRLAESASSLASPEEVRSWTRMASLLQIRGMTPQWAEALVRSGVTTIDRLQTMSGAEIAALLQNLPGPDAGPPTPLQLETILKDATTLRFTGALTGTIIDAEYQPVGGAVVRLGNSSTESDERGHFRLLRIRLGGVPPLRIEHPAAAPLVVPSPPIALDPDSIAVRVFRMEPPGTGAADPEGGTHTLSELDGDRLPAIAGRRVRQVMRDAGELSAGDVLVVHGFYASGSDVKLVSKFKSIRDGELLVHTVRMPLTRLPPDVTLHDCVRFDGSEFTRVTWSAAEFHRHKLRLEMKKAFRDRPVPSTVDERRTRIEEKVLFLLQRGFFPAKPRPAS